MPHKARARFGLALMLFASLIDSTSGLFTRLIHADNFTTVAGRGFVATAVLLLILVISDPRGGIQRVFHIGWPGLAFAFTNAIGMILTILSMRHTAVANFFMIFATAPFVAGVLGWLILRERLDGATALAAIAGFIGITVMMWSGATSGGLLGDVFALCCTFTYSIIVLIVRGARKFDLVPVLVVTTFLSGLLVLPWADFASVTPADGFMLFLFGTIQIAFGNICIFAAVARISPAQSGLLGVFNAAFAPVWVLVFLGEVPPTATLIGGAIVLGSAIAHLSYSLARPVAVPAN